MTIHTHPHRGTVGSPDPQSPDRYLRLGELPAPGKFAKQRPELRQSGKNPAAIHQSKCLWGLCPHTPGVYRFGDHRRGRKGKGRINAALPLRLATCGGAQVALQQSPILRPGIKQCTKNLTRGGHFSVITGGHFWVVITNSVLPAR